MTTSFLRIRLLAQFSLVLVSYVITAVVRFPTYIETKEAVLLGGLLVYLAVFAISLNYGRLYRISPILEVLMSPILLLAEVFPLYMVGLPFSVILIIYRENKKPAYILASGFILVWVSLASISHPGGYSLTGIITAGFTCVLVVVLRLMIKDQEQQKEKIRNRLENRESLLSTLSHEIRTPLTIVQSSVDMILESRTGPVNAIQAKFLQSTATNIRRLITISENILTSIKVEKTWFKVTPVPLDIRKTVIDVADQLEGILSGKNQKLKYSFPKRLPRPFADEQWIQQVLINLVHNSSKHLEHGGTIIISVVENELCIVVSVSDNGSGMSELDRMKAFSEFYQGNVENVTREMDGFGLGLTIVKRVIEKHGGKVYVGSVESLGTTVSFTLPKKEAPDG